VSEILKYKFFDELKKLSFIDRIMIYGSRARGDNDPRSDLDLAIECPDASEKDWLKVKDIIENADTLLKIDCVRLDDLSETNKLRINILKDAKLIYTRDG
jgi:predicted nucleotidyltransferase